MWRMVDVYEYLSTVCHTRLFNNALKLGIHRLPPPPFPRIAVLSFLRLPQSRPIGLEPSRDILQQPVGLDNTVFR